MLLVVAVWMVISAVTAQAVGTGHVLPVALAFVAVSAVLIPLDLRSRRLPRGVLFAGAGVVIAVQAIVAVRMSEMQPLVSAVVSMIAAAGVLVVAHLLSPQGIGAGDAAFAALAAGALGCCGYERVALGLGLGLVLAAVATGPIVLAAQRRVVAMSPSITLRPALAVGAWIALCWGNAIAGWY